MHDSQESNHKLNGASSDLAVPPTMQYRPGAYLNVDTNAPRVYVHDYDADRPCCMLLEELEGRAGRDVQGIFMRCRGRYRNGVERGRCSQCEDDVLRATISVRCKVEISRREAWSIRNAGAGS